MSARRTRIREERKIKKRKRGGITEAREVGEKRRKNATRRRIRKVRKTRRRTLKKEAGERAKVRRVVQ